MTSHIKHCFTRVIQPSVIVFLIFCLMMSSCRKLVEITPPSQSLAENNVYATDATAIGVLTGIYVTLTTGSGSSIPFQGTRSIGLLAGLSADELSAFEITNPYFSYYRNDLNALTSGSEHWSSLYSYIYKYNAAVEGLMKSSTLTPAVKQQLLGEAKFMRAFSYFYLVTLYGDVPLALSTNAVANTLLPRAPKAEVYNQIITDLKDAKELLSPDYLDITLLKTTNEKVRPTKWAAEALLARTYLYTADYAKAEEEATAVINNTTLFGPLSAIPLNDVFQKNSREAIWQLQPTTNDFNTMDGKMYVIPSTGPSSQNNPTFLSDFLQNSFEPGDERAVAGNWIDTTIYEASPGAFDTVAYPFKYKVSTSPGVTSADAMTEYLMVLRLAEQYLIRAEARAQQGNISGAQSDLNIIRNRAGLENTKAADQTSLLNAVLDERRHELFAEWGHRWLDLKRTGTVDAVMSAITPLKSNGSPWQTHQQWYPLSQNELNKAPNLIQNQGY